MTLSGSNISEAEGFVSDCNVIGSRAVRNSHLKIVA